MIKVDCSASGPEISSQIEKTLGDFEKIHADLKTGRCKGGDMTGWYDYPRKFGFDLLNEISPMIEEIKTKVYFDTIVVIGIGGSYLGTKAIYDAFSLKKSQTASFDKSLFFLGCDLCPEEMIETLTVLRDESNPLVVVISKSGTTLEPAVGLRLAWQMLIEKFGEKEARSRVIAITSGESGKLRETAQSFSWPIFTVPENVGGRYSVLTAVGLVPLLLAGGKVEALLEGANQFFSQDFSSQKDLYRYAAARISFHDELSKKLEVLVYNRPRLGSFVEWWKQLFAESEGKNGKGLFPTGFLTTTDLHSLGQYIQDGQRMMFETYLCFHDEGQNSTKKVGKAEGFSDGLDLLEEKSLWDLNEIVSKASLEAHAEGGACPIQVSVTTGLDFSTLGFLFAFFETACALSALSLGVNPFDQPGVEAYKKKMKELMVES